MKISLIVLLVTFCSVISAQEKRDAVIINTLDVTDKLQRNDVFRYAKFMDGTVISKSNDTTFVKMNYNQLSGNMLFIGNSGDTLEFASPETFRELTIGNDTFYFFKGNYLQKITHFQGGNLAVLQKLKFIGREKKGAYGTYSAVASINSIKTFTNVNQNTGNLNADERDVFRLNETFFVSDRFNNFFPAGEKFFYKLYFGYEKRLKGFIDSADIKFHNQANLKQLMEYVQTLH